MTIEFESCFLKNGKEEKIKMVAPLLKHEWEDDVYVIEFTEKETNIINRFEIKNDTLIIICGPSTLYLKSKENILNNYQTEYGEIKLFTRLQRLDFVENEKLYFIYKLLDENKNEINKFNIKMKIY
ncbi:MAG: hypothetical protein ACRDAW_02915 [Metamycoplasmataceae bacterium]